MSTRASATVAAPFPHAQPHLSRCSALRAQTAWTAGARVMTRRATTARARAGPPARCVHAGRAQAANVSMRAVYMCMYMRTCVDTLIAALPHTRHPRPLTPGTQPSREPRRFRCHHFDEWILLLFLLQRRRRRRGACSCRLVCVCVRGCVCVRTPIRLSVRQRDVFAALAGNTSCP